MRPVSSAQTTYREANEFCFETTRLRCRLLSEADQALYRSLYSSETMMRYIMKPLTEAAADQSFFYALRCIEKRPLQRLFLAVERKQDFLPLGITGISSLNWQEPSAEYGLMLTREGQGKGYAVEMTKACLTHLIHSMGMKRVWVDIAEENQAALKVARMAGLKADLKNCRIHEYSSV
ncbi:GNAT family N-acetyltransferase [Alkalimonas sp.]|uniref:GNAT family N-acetyltransferase n=1 Tax=Alkalimonas sp. TaxID=1872453 RepID=UPI00263AE251|nr:GNAT family N-acetyltransferase [Alkalimonas sp.]MCC5825744.1 GNAT family N-acetyltransferase [Alkalimonas sp.]